MNVVNALVYATLAGLSAIVAAGQLPTTPVEWCGLAAVIITAGWGKYTHSDSLLAGPTLRSGRDLNIQQQKPKP